MNPDKPKHVTDNNIVSEDIKPEGRKDGPKNFGPEFVTRDGHVVPTRPAEQTERVARAVAQAARAEGKDETEVVRSFAGAMPDDAVTLPASAEPIPDVVLGSMSVTDRAKHDEKNANKRKYSGEGQEALRMQYDIGFGLATDNKALPLEASSALEEGYNDAREGMKEQLKLRRERESGTQGPRPSPRAPEQKTTAATTGRNAGVVNPHPAGSQKAADFEAGAMYAHRGEPLPPDAPKEAKEGYDAALAQKSGSQ